MVRRCCGGQKSLFVQLTNHTGQSKYIALLTVFLHLPPMADFREAAPHGQQNHNAPTTTITKGGSTPTTLCRCGAHTASFQTSTTVKWPPIFKIHTPVLNFCAAHGGACNLSVSEAQARRGDRRPPSSICPASAPQRRKHMT